MLQSGTRLGSFEILSAIGAGGMGEVYKARDTRLDRFVAIKVLPGAFASDPARKQRFEREARAVSSLNHPHICMLYDVGSQDGVEYLVMEFLEGESLEERLKRGPLPLDEGLRYAIQITEALAAAHRQGVIHRDLKPGNIVLTKTGAKLLDFGLAKLTETVPGGTVTTLPTATMALTVQGAILGTFQYMSPEQLEGQEADARSDLFSLGAVLFEMFTGRKAFEGKGHASLISSIMTAEPPTLTALQPLLPPALDPVVRTCLAKDPDARWHTAHDVVVQLKWIAQAGSQAGVPAPVAAKRKSRERIAWLAAAVMALASVILGALLFRQPKPDNRELKFTLTVADGITSEWSTYPVVSPDGAYIAFTMMQNGKSTLWIRALNATEARQIPEADTPSFPFWSPDSRFLAFNTGHGLSKLDLAGGSITRICELPSHAVGTWGAENRIVFSVAGSASLSDLMQVSASGGIPEVFLTLNKTRGDLANVFPQFLPGGRQLLFFSRNVDAAKGGVSIVSLDKKDPILVMPGEIAAIPAGPRALAFVRQSTLFVQSFDPSSPRLEGEPVPVAQNVGTMNPILPPPQASFSNNGLFAYRQAMSTDGQLYWRNSDGKHLGAAGPPGRLRQFSLAPDGKRVVVEVLDYKTNSRDLWLLELASNIFSRLTYDPAEDSDPIWTADSRSVVFSSNRKGTLDLYRKTIGGGDEEVLFADKDRKVPEWALRDGSILYTTDRGGKMFLLSAKPERKSQLLFQRKFVQDEPHVSPDERWIAYSSQESGRWEVYAASFPSFGDIRQVSNNGGGEPQWRGDGKELYYLALDGNMMAVDVKAGPTIETGVPRTLFATGVRANPFNDQYAVTPDGKKFLVLEPLQQAEKPMTVVWNWNSAMTRR